MSALASRLARWVWYGLLWLMRRPWMRELQNKSIGWLPAARQAKARASILSQNRFARKTGLPLLTVIMHVVLASITVTVAFWLVMDLFESGLLSPPPQLERGGFSRL